jgi:histidine triad (HIT) family protein
VASVFTRIINGELPGRFVWRDERAVAFLTIAPLKPGHTLVVPVQEVEHWIDLEPDLLEHLVGVARAVGRAIERAFSPMRVGLAVVGIEVAHVHLHVTPLWSVGDLDFSKADADPAPDSLDDAAERIRAALREAGHAEVVD